MKYVSIDIETTGLDHKRHNVIEFGAVLDDLSVQADELPQFHAYVLPPDGGDYVGDPYALSMNHEILEKIAKRNKEWDNRLNPNGPQFFTPDHLAHCFELWCREQGLTDGSSTDSHGHRVKFVVAGKNVTGFDLPFLREQCFFSRFRISHRALDPGMLYFDPSVDSVPPNLSMCLERAGYAHHHSVVEHTAISDAMQVIRVIRAAYPLVDGTPTPRVVATGLPA